MNWWKQVSNWEKWPFKLIYAPLTVLWVYYAFKARAFWFFSNVNPTLEFAGFEGETKKEMYEQLPQHLYPKTLHITAGCAFNSIVQMLHERSMVYPIIVKPETGMQGILFRKLNTQEELEDYNKQMPFDYVIQDLVEMPYEFSVFHIRYPGQATGKVTGFILKEYLMVEGDGVSTLQALIRRDPRASLRQREMELKHQKNLHDVLAKGTHYYLTITGNHNRGARFINLHNQIDQQLLDVFDELSHSAGEFYFGRYDLKCTSIEDLKQGKNICILEFNGAGAEPNHIYDCGMTYTSALKEIARHWKDLYEIGKINLQRGVPYWDFWRGQKHMRKSSKFFDTLRMYDEKIAVTSL